MVILAMYLLLQDMQMELDIGGNIGLYLLLQDMQMELDIDGNIGHVFTIVGYADGVGY